MKTNAKLFNSENRIVRFFRAHYGTLFLLVFLVAGITLFRPNFLSSANFLNIFRQVSVYGIMATGMMLCILIGCVDLTVGATCAAAGCLCVALIESGVPIFFSVILSMAVSALIGAVTGSVVAFTKLPPYIITLSMQNVIRGIAYVFTGGFPVNSTNAAYNRLGSGSFTVNLGSAAFKIPYSVVLMIVIFAIFGILLHRTKLGRHIYSTGSNKEAARFVGINVKKIQILVFTFSSLLAGIAGIVLASRMNSAQPSVAVGYEGECIAMCVLGGVSFGGGLGTIGCTVIGTLIMGVISNGMNMLKIESFYQLIVKGGVMLLAVYFDSVKNELSLPWKRARN